MKQSVPPRAGSEGFANRSPASSSVGRGAVSSFLVVVPILCLGIGSCGGSEMDDTSRGGASGAGGTSGGGASGTSGTSGTAGEAGMSGGDGGAAGSGIGARPARLEEAAVARARAVLAALAAARRRVIRRWVRARTSA